MRKKLLLLLLVCCTELFAKENATTSLRKIPDKYIPAKNQIYRKGWIDFNKNGQKDIYEDPAAPIDARIEDLLSQMTPEEKSCQLATLYGYKRVLADDLPTPQWKEKIWKDGIGAIDEHLNGFVQWSHPVSDNPYVWPASRHAWALNEVQRFFVEETRLGIPTDFTNEGIRGVEAYIATNFPTQLGLGHTWNRALIRKVGAITGREGRLLGYTNIYAPILDVGRDQRWGRYEEVYGESPYLVAELAIEAVKGIQQEGQCAATAKHYIAYSNNKGAREGLARTDPQMSPREVENIHVYPWRRVIKEAGLLGAMSSYNDYDGFPIQSSYYWLTERLRKDFGFTGYVVSDSDAVEYLYTKHKTAKDMKEAVRQAILAGLNVRCTFTAPDTYILPLRELIREGAVPMSVVDDRVRDVLRVKFILGLFDAPYQVDLKAADREVNSPEHQAIALQASRESIVLLKNKENLLPLHKERIHRIAVCGPNADETSYALTHYGPLAVEVSTVVSGLREKCAGFAEVTYTKGCDLVDANWPESEIMDFEMTPQEEAEIAKAVSQAQAADVAVVVLGGGQRTCGENKTRTSLNLPGRQEQLLRAIYKTGKPVVLVLINGRPLSINWADKNIPAIVEAWYPGSKGGYAIADVLFGDYNPGGKLTVTVPKTVGQIPFNFPNKPNAQTNESSRVNGALYPFGYGLSYTTFRYANLTIEPQVITPYQPVTIRCDITNTGDCAGEEVVQLYTRDLISSVTTYERNLNGFERIPLQAGETKTLSFTLYPRDLQLYNAHREWVVEPGDFEIMIGASSENILLRDTLTVVESLSSISPSPSAKKPHTHPEENLRVASDKKELILHRGESLTLPLLKIGFVDQIQLAWKEVSFDAAFEIQYTNGGGQFLTLYKGTLQDSDELINYPFSRQECEAIRLVITQGKATLYQLNFPEGKEVILQP